MSAGEGPDTRPRIFEIVTDLMKTGKVQTLPSVYAAIKDAGYTLDSRTKRSARRAVYSMEERGKITKAGPSMWQAIR